MNPFLSKNFIDIWLQHFGGNSKPESFEFISPQSFLKNKNSLFYYNVGKNLTNGTEYTITPGKLDFKGKVFLIHDVHQFFHEDQTNILKRLKIKKVPQYKGYLSKLEGFSNIDEYLMANLSKRGRYKVRDGEKKLRKQSDLDFKVFYGALTRQKYDEVIGAFYELLGKRWDDLGKDNDILRDRNYYSDLAYDMILAKEASLNVLYADNKIIAVSLCFLSTKVLYFAITSFDSDYARFSLGHILIGKIIVWCLDNGIEYFDYSKGDNDYKNRWATDNYLFENHILYDKKSLRAFLIGNYLYLFYRIKQELREKKFNVLYSKIKYFLKKNKS
ncbi:GNAT family N-acetyltransferase [Flagellimonas sp. S3867]|uniref:GNAT family N-acetyltransferase n=1 Tax=Flagellimonas sp. S3867 TaxID=2768063 RepID=UPI00168A3F8E|nr:GNAT family N-acetyltransferase [Flagellimonas sp. S3867]